MERLLGHRAPRRRRLHRVWRGGRENRGHDSQGANGRISATSQRIWRAPEAATKANRRIYGSASGGDGGCSGSGSSGYFDDDVNYAESNGRRVFHVIGVAVLNFDLATAVVNCDELDAGRQQERNRQLGLVRSKFLFLLYDSWERKKDRKEEKVFILESAVIIRIMR